MESVPLRGSAWEGACARTQKNNRGSSNAINEFMACLDGRRAESGCVTPAEN
jgi:hypothetical protein